MGASLRAHDWATRIERGLVATSTVTRLEVGYSGTFSKRFRPRVGPVSDRLHACGVPGTSDGGPCTPGSAHARAARTPPRPVDPDLLIASTAELSGRTVLHLDEDFDRIAELTQQPTERLDS